MSGPPLPMVIDALEASGKPVVAAIDGVALGGGCEVALGCHWRLASARSQVGLPEVNLGLLPGAGGTQRLPRLIGADPSVDFMCRGAPVKAAQALKVGIFDQVLEGDNAAVVQAAVNFAARQLSVDLATRRLCNGKAKATSSDALDAKRKEYMKLRAGEAAPQAIITCIEAAASKDFRDGMNVEGTEFGKLFRGSQSKALQYMFFAERQCFKIPGLESKPKPLNSAGIIGAGLMGGGIAMCCAEAGMKVVVLDVDQKNLERGMSVIQKNYARSVERKSKSQEQVDKLLANITASTSYDSLSQCDIVVEAVYENMDLKKKIFATLDQVCKPGSILASNTSYLNIDEIASATKRPQDVIGCHFFSPANVMRLLENVRGPRTSPETIATAMAFGSKLKKVTCLVGNCGGFIANRVMGVSGFPYLLHKGLLPHEIDEAAEAYGMRMGPARMNDLVGIDLFGRERAKAGIAQPEKNVFDAIYKAERFGQKNGKGFYKYDEKRRNSRDPDAEAIIQQVWQNIGVQKQSMEKEDVIDMLYLPVVNEGFKCLEEGMAIRPSDIDVCCVFGYNWPRYRGGPMQWASAVGLPKVLSKVEAMGLKPSELLQECVKNNWRLNSKEFLARTSATWNAKWSTATSKM
ncbi:ehhadh [Symbiodinium pilosum]|uniref:Ehhadh protein n=1 Tax=Symbiodinium pilosum TaxID=2952 RepID=A0A812IZD7_SYMPI|nr:ehhadh [Symbiodinium pilosum]